MPRQGPPKPAKSVGVSVGVSVVARASKGLAPITVERIGKAKADAAFDIAAQLAPSRPSPGKPARLSDGGGLYLAVEPTGSARWLFLFRWRGKLKEMGLGGLTKVSLKTAREKAAGARELIGKGVNPIEARRAAEAIPTFGEVADDVLAEVIKGFKNPKHEASWRRAIGAPRTPKVRKGGKWTEGSPVPSYAEPLRPKRVDEVTTNDVLRVLKPLWSSRHETASRLRGQIAQVLDAAKARGHRTGENPAAWGGNLKHMLAARRKLTQGHRAALPYMDVPTFMAALRTRPALSAKALEFAILTAARAGEVYGMTWGEIDLDAKLWVVPPRRMKGAREHRVPLTDAAVEIIKAMALTSNQKPDTYVFPGSKAKAPLSDAAVIRLIRRMGFPKITTHGFRSSFRDWAGDATRYPRDLAEQALAHAITSDVEAAYHRSDALERRRKLMADWADYCAGAQKVIELVRAG